MVCIRLSYLYLENMNRFGWNATNFCLEIFRKNSAKRSSVHCWCNLVAVRAASFDDKKFLIFQGGQWFVDQLWERWNQWVKNGSQWSSNYNLSSLEINGPSPPAEEDFFSPSSSKQETVGSSNEFYCFFKLVSERIYVVNKKFYVNNQIIKLFEKQNQQKILISSEAKSWS